MVGNLHDTVRQLANRRVDGPGEADQESKGNQNADDAEYANPQQGFMCRMLRHLAFPVDGGHVQAHHLVQCHADTLDGGIVHILFHGFVLRDQMGGRDILVHFRYILLLQVQVLFELGTCHRICLDTFEGIQHTARIQERIVIIRQDILRICRHAVDILYRKTAQQDNHCKQQTYTIGELRFNLQTNRL